MNFSQQFWDEVMDGIDEKLTDRAAERMTRAGDVPLSDDFADGRAVEIKPAPRKKSKAPLFIGIGVAAAAIVGITLRIGMESVQPPVVVSPSESETSQDTDVEFDSHITFHKDMGDYDINVDIPYRKSSEFPGYYDIDTNENNITVTDKNGVIVSSSSYNHAMVGGQQPMISTPELMFEVLEFSSGNLFAVKMDTAIGGVSAKAVTLYYIDSTEIFMIGKNAGGGDYFPVITGEISIDGDSFTCCEINYTSTGETEKVSYDVDFERKVLKKREPLVLNRDLLSELGMTYTQFCEKYGEGRGKLNALSFDGGYGRYGWKPESGILFEDMSLAGGCNMIMGIDMSELFAKATYPITFNDLVFRYGFEPVSLEATTDNYWGTYCGRFRHQGFEGVYFLFVTNFLGVIDETTNCTIGLDLDCLEATPVASFDETIYPENIRTKYAATKHSFTFPASDYGKSESKADIFSIEPFELSISLPEGWTSEIVAERVDSGITSENSPIKLFNGDKPVATIDFNVFDPTVVNPDSPDYRAVYNQLMMSSIVSWDYDYAPVKNTADSEAAVCKIMTRDENPVNYHRGILAYNRALGVYITIYFEDVDVDDMTVYLIASSVIIE